MKKKRFSRIISLLICLSVIFTFTGGLRINAADEIWTEAPTQWRHASHVLYETRDGHLCNWGVRGETALFLSKMATDFYPELEQGCYPGDGLEGGTGESNAADSELYAVLRDLLNQKQAAETSAEDTKELLRYTDCMLNACDSMSSFYSSIKLDPAGNGWELEHIWPAAAQETGLYGDIMALRPVRTGESAARTGKPYGVGDAFYDPGEDVRGDVARILLYCWTRWDIAATMWGPEGVIESADVLLDWMQEDPVDLWEMGRNDAVEAITGVRNCYVDFPHLAWQLFGKDCPEIPTPRNHGESWPPATVHVFEYSAFPDDPDHGTVEMNGLAAIPKPAEGYYASGFDVIQGTMLVPGETDPSDLVWWDHGRLLCIVGEEVHCEVMIHFTPVGETDPCPTGHSLDREHPVSKKDATCTAAGEEVLICGRCGKTCVIPINQLEHEMDEGTVTREPTIEQEGLRTYRCRVCGEVVLEEPVAFMFDDVDYEEYRFYTDAVYLAVGLGITKGTDATHFSPDNKCSRAEIVTFLWREAGMPEPESRSTSFTDVKPGSFYCDSVAWAVENGITKGMDAKHFDPDAPCTRAQIVTFLWRAAGEGKPSAACDFKDVPQNTYYATAVSWAVENDITYGTSDTAFSPKKTCTRAEAVTFIARKRWNS